MKRLALGDGHRYDYRPSLRLRQAARTERPESTAYATMNADLFFDFSLEDVFPVTFRHFFSVILCCSMAFGQAASPVAPAPPATAASTTQPAAPLPPDAPVITIKGVCTPPSAADCSTVVTKADFEALVQAVQPQMPLKMQRQMAAGYAQLLTMAAEARKRGLDNSPRVQVRTKISVMQALQRELAESAQEEAGKISDADIEKYYAEHKSNFEQADMQRLFIPRVPQPADKTEDKKVNALGAAKTGAKAAGTKTAASAGAATKKPATAKPAPVADEASMKALAAKLRTRAAAGEDFSKLQVEAFTAAHIKAAVPETKLTKATRNALPPNHRAVFDLAPGAVSELITEGNGYYVYKMSTKTTQSLDDAKSDIRTAIKNERLQQAMEAISKLGTTTFNDAYFGPAEQSVPPQGPGAPGHPPADKE